jgi:hypothetical protein
MHPRIPLALALASLASIANAATPIATYQFNNTFAPNEVGRIALTASDPAGTSVFMTDTVLGQSRTVWAFNGSASPPAQQSGVTAVTIGQISPQSYSVDMVLEFLTGQNAWRRIIDVENRQSDAGFYVNPSNNLAVFPVSGSTAAWSNGVYHHLVMTDNGTTVIGYLDGVSQFTTNTTIMNLDADPVNNPNRLMGFFLDNVVGGGQGEWSNGRVSLIRLWDGVLTPQEAQTLANNPFVPEPSTATALLAACGLAAQQRRRRADY